MAIRVEVYGDSLIDAADEILEEIEPRAREAVREAADMLLNEVRRLLRLRSGPPAAPEGEPPAKRTGELLKSFRRIPVSVKGRVVSSGIQSNHPGANRLEFGVVDKLGRRTLPHPYIRPAMERMEGPITAFLERAL